MLEAGSFARVATVQLDKRVAVAVKFSERDTFWTSDESQLALSISDAISAYPPMKRRHSSAAMEAAFLREVHVLRNVQHHPNIVGYLYHFSHGPYNCIVMELGRCDLFNLLLERSGSLDPLIVSGFAQNIRHALAHLHGLSYEYNDLKPENLIVFPDDTLKLADFGLSQNLHERQRLTAGTQSYAAPELFPDYEFARVAFKSDMWSFGVCVHTMCYFATPFAFAHANDPRFGRFRRIVQETRCTPGEALRAANEVDNSAPDSRRMMDQLLLLDPRKRASAAELR